MRKLSFMFVVLFSAARIATANTVVVELSNFKFVPSTVTINVGDTVTWVSRQGNHDVQSDSALFKSPFPVSTFSFTFTQAGTIPYHCNPHRSFGMVGTVIVQAAPQNVPPTVSIASPANGASFTAPATVPVSVSASDSDGSIAKVELISGRTVVGTLTSAPYDFTLQNLAAGAYTLTARATDNAGAATVSSGVSITVTAANAPPSVSITTPTEGAIFKTTDTITIEAAASDADGSVAKVEFFQNGIAVGSANSSPFRVSASLAAGNYALTAQATDNQGATTTSAAVNISVQAVAPPSAPQLSGAKRLPDGSFQFVVTSQKGRTHVIQASSDLATWSAIQTIVPDSDTFTVTDGSAAGVRLRFYRVQAL